MALIRNSMRELTDLLVCTQCLFPGAVGFGVGYTMLDDMWAAQVDRFLPDLSPALRGGLIVGSVCYGAASAGEWLRMQLNM